MKKYNLLFVAFVSISLHFSCSITEKKEKAPLAAYNEIITYEEMDIGNPKKAENLSVFILTGKEKIKGKSYSTLSEAMKDKKVVVKETGKVSQLAIDNNSDDYVYINSGDIVKGGKQDRTITYDVIIPPKAKNVALESFCVEQGRWEKREGESLQAFSSNSKMLSSKDLKLAARYKKNQQEVWSKVSEQKTRLNEKISKKAGYAVKVENEKSDTSLELALDSKELKKLKKDYFNKLNNLINTPNAVGYAYAINGEIHSVETYNNHQLFKDLWKKSLESIIVEAISKQDEKVKKSVTKKQILSYMEAVSNADKKENRKLNSVTKFKTSENKKGNVVFTTEDTNHKKWVHKSFMKKDSTSNRKSI